MNILIDTLPDHIEVDGVSHKVRTSFRDCLRVMVACEDNTLTTQEKQIILLSNVYHDFPDNVEDALMKAMWFLDGGKEFEKAEGSPRLFSFTKDANLIYAAFRQTHNVDLTTATLHWWEFLALFMDLGQDTTFCQMVSLRSRVKSGKASKEERQMAFEMGDAFKVDEIDSRTLEEKEQEREFLRLVGANAPR